MESPSSIISIYQNYYSDKQIPYLDKAFIPHDNSKALHPEYREYPIFLRFHENKIHKQSQMTGIMSWKFGEKTLLSGDQFIQFIKDNPGYDVYFVNPFTLEERHMSVWKQGELCHPDIIDLAQYVFDQIGYDIRIKDVINTTKTTAYCNFWVGTETFWDAYIAFTKPVFEYIAYQAPESIRKKFFIRADRKTDSVYFPFVMERLFSTLLWQNKSIKSLNYEYDLAQLIDWHGKEWAHYLLGIRMLDQGNCTKAREHFAEIKPFALKKLIRDAIRHIDHTLFLRIIRKLYRVSKKLFTLKGKKLIN